VDIDVRKEVRSAARGNGDAAARLFDHYHPRVFRYALGKLRHESEAEDVASECFARVLSELDRFRWRGGGFEPWLFRIAYNLVVDRIRDRRREQTAAIPDEEASGRGPDEIVLGHETASELQELLDRLVPEQREVLLLRFAAGLDVAETAAVMGKSQNALRQLQFRALSKVRSMKTEATNR
jgi:RNA polymerase sigma-70 factor (ECF subfamily)